MTLIVTNALIFYNDKIGYTINQSVAVNARSVFDSPYVVSSALSFIFVWIATVLLLHYYSKKIGRVRYWLIVSIPLFYFLVQYQSLIYDFSLSFRLSNPTLFSIIISLLFTMGKPIGGFLFGIAFWVDQKSQQTFN